MVVTGGLQTDLYWPGQRTKELHEMIVIGAAIGELEPLPSAGCVLHQRDVPVFSDIDCDQVRGRCRVLLVNHRGVCSWSEMVHPRMPNASVIDQSRSEGKEKGFVRWGLRPQTPGIYRIPARMAAWLAERLTPLRAIPAAES